MNEELSKLSVADLNHMLSDDTLVDAILTDENKEFAKYKKLNKNGSLTLGKTKWTFWNKLLGGEWTVSFETLIIQIIKGLTGHHNNKNEEVLAGMSADFCQNMFREYKKNELVEMVFAYYRFGNKTGYFDKNVNPPTFQDWLNAGSKVKQDFGSAGFAAVHDGVGTIGLIPMKLFVQQMGM